MNIYIKSLKTHFSFNIMYEEYIPAKKLNTINTMPKM